MSLKDDVIKLIQNLPENVTIDDIMNELYIRTKIEAGIKELDEGKGIDHEVVKGRFSKWLN